MALAGCPASCSALMDGCKGTVDVRCCNWLDTSAAFTAKVASWPMAQPDGKGAADHSWHSERNTETEYKRNWTECIILYNVARSLFLKCEPVDQKYLAIVQKSLRHLVPFSTLCEFGFSAIAMTTLKHKKRERLLTVEELRCVCVKHWTKLKRFAETAQHKIPHWTFYCRDVMVITEKKLINSTHSIYFWLSLNLLCEFCVTVYSFAGIPERNQKCC